MDDSRIVELFYARSENAIIELSKKYGGICINMATNILSNREDANECVNDSYLVLWNRIPPNKPNPLLAFLLRIVRNLSIKRNEHNTAQKRNSTYNLCIDELSWCISADDTPCSSYEMKETMALVDEFLDSISAENRMLFVRRYWFIDSFKELSNASGISEAAIRTRLSRIRSDLREYMKERGMIE